MFSRVRSYYNNCSIYQKIALVIIPLLAFSSLLTLLISSLIFTSSLSAQIQQTTLDECSLIAEHISHIYENSDTCLSVISKDINSIYASASGKDKVDFVSTQNKLLSSFSYNRQYYLDISSIVFIDTDQNVVQNGLKSTPKAEDLQPLIQGIDMDGPPTLCFFPVEYRPCFSMEKPEPVLTLGKPMISFDNGELLGYIFLNIRSSRITATLPQNSYSDYFVIDASNRIIATQQPENHLTTFTLPEGAVLPQDDSPVFFNGTHALAPTFYIAQKIHPYNWYLIVQISKNELFRPAVVNAGIAVLLGVLTVIFVAGFVLYVSRKIVFPVKQLVRCTEQISAGDLSVRCPVTSADEVGALSAGFNVMLDKVLELMNHLAENQKKKEAYRLALLQSQIKPHFLYNAIDLIYVLCKMGYNEKAAETSKALADFYRTSLSEGADIVTLDQEIRNVRNYLLVQQARYSDTIAFRLKVDQDILPFAVPKMLLQPLVENAIYHGLKEKNGGGTITILGRQEGEHLILLVQDDGVGMSQQVARDVMNTDPVSPHAHFGLRSTNERIKLYYGPAYGLEILSAPGEGTTIRITLPCRTDLQE